MADTNEGMTSPQAAAVEELKLGLIEKFGEAQETQDVVSREVASLFASKRRIDIRDLNLLESQIAKEVGPPRRRRYVTARRSVAQHSALPQNRETTSKTPQPTYSGRLSFNEVTGPEDFREVPAVGSIVQRVTGKRRAPTTSPTSLFPRVDGSPITVRASPDLSRNISPIDYGQSEELRFREKKDRRKFWDARKEDSWGKVLRWDSAKYMAEEEEKKEEKEKLKRWYKEELDKQLRRREDMSPEEDKTARATSLLLTEKPKTSGTAQRHVSVLDAMVMQKQERLRSFREEKRREREQIDDLIARDREEKADLANTRKAALQSLKAFQMKTAAEKLIEKKARKAESRERMRRRMEQELKLYSEAEQRKASARHAKLRKIAEENREKAYKQRERSREKTIVGDFNLAEDAERRLTVKREMQARTTVVLHRQVMEKSQRSNSRKQLLSDQAEMWAEEKAQNDAEDAERAAEKKRRQQELSALYAKQMEDRARRRRAECDFSPEEVKLNRALVEAATGFPDSVYP